MAPSNLGDAIAAVMRERDIRQHQVASELGVTQQTLSKWMNGKHRPSREVYPALAKFLGVTVEEVRAFGPTYDPTARVTASKRVERAEERLTQLALSHALLVDRVDELTRRLEAIAPAPQQAAQERHRSV